MSFIKGQRVRLSRSGRRNHQGDTSSEGYDGTMECSCEPYVVQWDNGRRITAYYDVDLQLATEKNKMNLTEKMALVFKGEPEKSFIKAGVMNSDETLTPEGKELFFAFMLKEHAKEFKSKVVDPILAEMKDNK